jgi:hypothetical protein
MERSLLLEANDSAGDAAVATEVEGTDAEGESPSADLEAPSAEVTDGEDETGNTEGTDDDHEPDSPESMEG